MKKDWRFEKATLLRLVGWLIIIGVFWTIGLYYDGWLILPVIIFGLFLIAWFFRWASEVEAGGKRDLIPVLKAIEEAVDADIILVRKGKRIKVAIINVKD
jgi:hypothetical protein